MKRNTAWALLLVILLGAFFLRQYRLLDFPYHGDEVDEGDIALDILHGHLAPFYPQNEGNEALYQFVLAPFFAVLGDSVIAGRFPSATWSIILVALMYTFGRKLFHGRRVGVMAAGLTAALWWSTVFGRLGLREISQPTMMTPALLGLLLAFRATNWRAGLKYAIVGGVFAGLVSYTFLSGRGFPVIVVLFVAYAAVAQRKQLIQQWRALLVYVVLMVAVAIPLFAYMAAHPELDYHVQDLGGQSWIARGDWGQAVPQVLNTLGMFTFSGDMNWVRNIPGRPVFPGPEGILFYLGIALCVWRWRNAEYVLPLIVIATYLGPNVIAENPPWFTRSIGILPGLLLIPVLPVEWIWERLEQWQAPRALAASASYAALVGLLGISIYARTAADMFTVWIDNPGVYWMTLAFYDGAGKYVNASADSTPFNYVMDYYTDWRKHNIERPIERMDVAVRYSVGRAFVFPEDPRGGRIAFQIQGAPAAPLLNAFLDLEHPVFVDARVDSAGERPLRVYAVPRAQLDEHYSRARANPVFLPGTGTPLVGALKASSFVQFIGYEILNPDAPRGSDLNMLTYWRVLQRPPQMAVFVHLVNAQQKVVAQFDGFDAVVDDLQPGDTVVQLHALTLPGDLAAETYQLEMGVYTRDSLARLPLSTGTDSVWLQSWYPVKSK